MSSRPAVSYVEDRPLEPPGMTLKNQPEPPFSVVVLEQERTTREILVRALDNEDGVICTGAGPEAAEVAAVAERRADAVLVGLHTTGTEAPEAVSAARRWFPGAWLVVLCTYVDDEVHEAAIGAGADAVLNTAVAFEELVDCLRTGRADPMVCVNTRSVHRDARAAERAEELGVTPRQHEVLRHLARGLSPDAVARRLGISVATCRDHIKGLHRALECTTTSELLVVSGRVGLLPELSRPLR